MPSDHVLACVDLCLEVITFLQHNKRRTINFDQAMLCNKEAVENFKLRLATLPSISWDESPTWHAHQLAEGIKNAACKAFGEKPTLKVDPELQEINRAAIRHSKSCLRIAHHKGRQLRDSTLFAAFTSWAKVSGCMERSWWTISSWSAVWSFNNAISVGAWLICRQTLQAARETTSALLQLEALAKLDAQAEKVEKAMDNGNMGNMHALLRAANKPRVGKQLTARRVKAKKGNIAYSWQDEQSIIAEHYRAQLSGNFVSMGGLLLEEE